MKKKLIKYLKTVHSYHLVDLNPFNPWPLVVLLILTSGLVLYMHKILGGWNLFTDQLTQLFVFPQIALFFLQIEIVLFFQGYFLLFYLFIVSSCLCAWANEFGICEKWIGYFVITCLLMSCIISSIMHMVVGVGGFYTVPCFCSWETGYGTLSIQWNLVFSPEIIRSFWWICLVFFLNKNYPTKTTISSHPHISRLSRNLELFLLFVLLLLPLSNIIIQFT